MESFYFFKSVSRIIVVSVIKPVFHNQCYMEIIKFIGDFIFNN
ncbi:hypothetical protein bmyco0003_2610 [Bacillus pseudomycoides]|nr:hypothetical protein bmyco0002_2690 [Bacillus pseudomycoides]EEM12922.1 hypothetical protein bmyco0003_2610 [Bacillus pseudomycoides]EEM18770.1 hypothetical protein bpmyx0001_2390 [Bacillus pseudomycoides DSM 12442]